jgi:hypothetical protein
MSNLFERYISEGKEKTNSLKKRLSDIEHILEQLSLALKSNDIDLVIEPTNNSRGVGFKAEISTELFIKKFITITIPKSEREAYILERNGDIDTYKSTDELIVRIGEIISSVPFWQEVDDLKKMDKNHEIPF